MGLFDKIKAGIGIGGAKLEIALEPGSVPPGGLARGRVILRGGKQEQKCDGIKVLLVRKWRTTEDRGGRQEQTGHQETLHSGVLPDSSFKIAPGSQQEYPFEIPVPNHVPPDSTLEVGATADIPGMIDPVASADLPMDWSGAGGDAGPTETEELAEQPYERDDGPDAVLMVPKSKTCMLVRMRGDQLEFFDTDSGDYQHGFELEYLRCASVSPGGDQVLTGDADGVIRAHDFKSGEVLDQTESLTDTVRYIRWLGRSGRFVAGTDNRRIEVFEHPGLVSRNILQEGDDSLSIRGLAASPDGKRVFFSEIYSVRCLDAESGEQIWEQTDLPAPNAGAIDVSPDGRFLALALSGWGVCWVNAADGQLGPSFQFGDPCRIHWPGMQGDYMSWSTLPRFSPSGKRLALNTPVGNLMVLDGITGEVIWDFERGNGMAWINDLVWLDDNRLLLACIDRRFAIWTLEPLTFDVDTEL